MRAGLIDTIRLSSGLRWKHRMPTPAEIGMTLRNIGVITVLLLAYGIVGSIDYAEEQRQEAEAARASAELHRAALLACLNGSAPGLYTVDEQGRRHYIICAGENWEVTDENVTRKARL